MMVGWGVSAILTTADVLSSDRNNVQFYARTDTRSHVITNSPWFSFPYPGTLEWWGGVRGRTLSFFHSLSFLSFPHTLILRFSVSFCVIPSLVFSLFSSFPPLSFYHFFWSYFLSLISNFLSPFSFLFLFIFCHFFSPHHIFLTSPFLSGRFGAPSFDTGIFIGFLLATLMSILDSIGDYSACARTCYVPQPPNWALNRGLAVEGFMSFISGALGIGHATSSFGGNIGAMGLTRVSLVQLQALPRALEALFCSLFTIVSLILCYLKIISHMLIL